MRCLSDTDPHGAAFNVSPGSRSGSTYRTRIRMYGKIFTKMNLLVFFPHKTNTTASSWSVLYPRSDPHWVWTWIKASDPDPQLDPHWMWIWMKRIGSPHNGNEYRTRTCSRPCPAPWRRSAGWELCQGIADNLTFTLTYSQLYLTLLNYRKTLFDFSTFFSDTGGSSWHFF